VCEPTTLLIIGTTLQAGGGILKAESEIQTLKFQSKVAENNARIADIQAEDEKKRGAQVAKQLLRDTSKSLSEQVAATVGAGVAVEGASAQEVFDNTKLAGAADVLEAERNTAKAVWGITTKAKGLRAQAANLRRAARRRRLLQPIEAVAPLISGFGQVGVLRASQ
jgi:hypothetical protein